MDEPQPILLEDMIKQLPASWMDGRLRHKIYEANKISGRCIVALDDDPTGTQTVHDIWVLTGWDEESIRSALADNEPALYFLTNSRGMPLAEAQAMNVEIVTNLMCVARQMRRPITLVSRSDSTLRGHYPGETDVIQHTLEAKFQQWVDGVCLIPFFAEGGRFTIHDMHWVQEDGLLIPAAQTPYAKDAVFGYCCSYLPDWIEEKTGGRVKPGDVALLSLDLIRLGGPDSVYKFLMNIQGGKVLVVNAVEDRDLEVFVSALLRAEEQGKTFLFRTAASFVKVASGLPDKPLLTREDLFPNQVSTPGLVVFGSHVPKSTAQLEAIKGLERIQAIELQVKEVLNLSIRSDVIKETAQAVSAALRCGLDAVLFTSRGLIAGDSSKESLEIGKSVSSALVEVINRLDVRPGYVIGKGGITASDLATQSMQVRAARVMGQILPGVPVWKLGSASRWPGLVYVVFPGNVGDEGAVARVIQQMRE